jgi:microcystin-dependent protein
VEKGLLMPNIKISELPAASAASTSQEFEVNDSGTSKKVTGSQIKTFVKDGLLVSDVTDLTATAAELNYVDGVTSSIQTQLNDKFKQRTITGTADQITVTNGDGVSGNPTIALAAAALNVGQVAFFAQNTAPTGWLKANGALVSRSTYSALFAAIGTTFGAGDGSTTFALPDMRGEFPRGWDDGRGVDSGRGFGSTQSQGIQSHTHPQTNFAANSQPGNRPVGFANTTGAATFDFSTASSGGAETRPRNIALLACIKF